jgi:hypothetical protein
MVPLSVFYLVPQKYAERLRYAHSNVFGIYLQKNSSDEASGGGTEATNHAVGSSRDDD